MNKYLWIIYALTYFFKKLRTYEIFVNNSADFLSDGVTLYSLKNFFLNTQYNDQQIDIYFTSNFAFKDEFSYEGGGINNSFR